MFSMYFHSQGTYSENDLPKPWLAVPQKQVHRKLCCIIKKLSYFSMNNQKHDGKHINTQASNVKFCTQALRPEFQILDKPAGSVQEQHDGSISQPQFFVPYALGVECSPQAQPKWQAAPLQGHLTLSDFIHFSSCRTKLFTKLFTKDRKGKVQVHWVFIISHGFTISLHKHAKDYWIWMIEVLLSFIILTHWGHCWCYLPYNSCTMDGARRIMQHSRRKKTIQVLGSPTHRVKQLQDRSTEAKDEP